MGGMLRFRWVRTLLTPLAIVAAKRITIENPTDTIAMLRAEDAFDVRDRLDDIQTETLVICGAQDHFWTPEMFAETAFRLPRGKVDHVSATVDTHSSLPRSSPGTSRPSSE